MAQSHKVEYAANVVLISLAQKEIVQVFECGSSMHSKCTTRFQVICLQEQCACSEVLKTSGSGQTCPEHHPGEIISKRKCVNRRQDKERMIKCLCIEDLPPSRILKE